MAVGLCVILSPAEGPQALAKAVRQGVSEDAAWIVVQRHVSGDEFETLAECLEELAARPVARLHSEPLPLHGGVLCLAGNGMDARREGHRLAPRGPGPLDLDAFLRSLAEPAGQVQVAVLPGREMPEGLAGLSGLQEKGVALVAAEEDQDPAGWAAALAGAGIRFQRRPLNALFDTPSTKSGAAPLGRLLIADDDPRTRELLGEYCRMRGYARDFAADGLDVLRLLRKQTYTGLILDIHMPELDGIQTLERLKSERPELPVLVVTGETDPEVLDKVTALGAAGVLAKSFTADQFHRALAVFDPAGDSDRPPAVLGR
jgi:CheY-like chemotaxis protein